MSQKNYIVDTTSVKDNQRRVMLRHEGAKGQLALMLHRYALIGSNDRAYVSTGHSPKVSVVSSEDSADQIQVTPTFNNIGEVNLGSFKLEYKIVEPHKQDDFKSLQYLEQFHYKTFEPPTNEDGEIRKKSSESVGGRRAILLCYLRLNDSVVPAGYLELQMPLLMVKPRHALFAIPFTHPSRPISWSAWNQDAIRKNVNLITRVARVVVAPDFRGLGLAKIMIEAAKEFARTKWHISGRRPLFMEISAEMLNYIDFVSGSGFTFIGKTEGNLERIVADLIQMRKGQKISSGIMTLQQKYLRALEKYCEESGKDFDDVLYRLAEVVKCEDPAASLSPSEWLAFRNVIRFPLPYYLCGLDEASQAYLAEHATKKNIRLRSRSRFKTDGISLKLKDLKVATNYRIPHSRYTRLIMDSFGIRGDVLKQTVFGPLSIEASAGNIVFVAGPSGSGKSILLRAVDPNGMDAGELLVRTSRSEQNYLAAWLKPLESEKPIFDYFAERYSPEATFAVLSNVGLSEAFIFLKPFKFLSRGQRYRAMLADLLLRDEPVWIIDEFCADLDPLSAKIVAHNLRRHVMRSGRICFVAAANNSHFIDVLRPTSVIVLSTGAEPKFTTFREYKNEFLYKVG